MNIIAIYFDGMFHTCKEIIGKKTFTSYRNLVLLLVKSADEFGVLVKWTMYELV